MLSIGGKFGYVRTAAVLFICIPRRTRSDAVKQEACADGFLFLDSLLGT